MIRDSPIFEILFLFTFLIKYETEYKSILFNIEHLIILLNK